MKLLTIKQMVVTLICLVVMAPLCLIYYFGVCGDSGCGDRSILFTMLIVVFLVVVLANILFGRDTRPRRDIPPLPGQEPPRMDLPGVLGSMIGVVFAVLCGMLLRAGLHSRYCLDEHCANLEDGGQMIETATIVVVFSVLMLIWGIAEYRRNRR